MITDFELLRQNFLLCNFGERIFSLHCSLTIALLKHITVIYVSNIVHFPPFRNNICYFKLFISHSQYDNINIKDVFSNSSYFLEKDQILIPIYIDYFKKYYADVNVFSIPGSKIGVEIKMGVEIYCHIDSSDFAYELEPVKLEPVKNRFELLDI